MQKNLRQLEDYNPKELEGSSDFQVLGDKTVIKFDDIKGVEDRDFEYEEGKPITKYLYHLKSTILPLLITKGTHKEIVGFKKEGGWLGIEIRKSGEGKKTKYKVIPLK